MESTTVRGQVEIGSFTGTAALKGGQPWCIDACYDISISGLAAWTFCGYLRLLQLPRS